MALELSRTLYNGQQVAYHRIAAYSFSSPSVVIATVESYRNRGHREFSFVPVIKTDIDFPFDGDVATMPQQAYDYIKSLPEWQGAADV